MNWCQAHRGSSELVSAFGIVAYPSHYIKPDLLCFRLLLCGNILAVCWIGSMLGALVHPLVGCGINFIIWSFPFMWGPCACFFPNFSQSRRLSKSESAYIEGCCPGGQVSLGIFPTVNGNGTSEVMRRAFSDVLPLFSMLLLPAWFFFVVVLFFF